MSQITVGSTIPEAKLLKLGANGPETVELSSLLKDRKVVIFGLPGAYTGTCTTAHLPSFIRTIEAFKAKGVAEVICTSVNDPFVLGAWADATGGAKAGISFLADPEAAFAKALGLDFSAAAVGLLNRSKRYALLADNGVVTVLHLEASPGQCEISGGEALLAEI